jgi:hypothetical protein
VLVTTCSSFRRRPSVVVSNWKYKRPHLIRALCPHPPRPAHHDVRSARGRETRPIARCKVSLASRRPIYHRRRRQPPLGARVPTAHSRRCSSSKAHVPSTSRSTRRLRPTLHRLTGRDPGAG